jgi:hypothetical protein
MHSIRRADTGHAQRDGRHKIYRFLTAFLMSSNPQVRDIHDMGRQRLHKKKPIARGKGREKNTTLLSRFLPTPSRKRRRQARRGWRPEEGSLAAASPRSASPGARATPMCVPPRPASSP